MVFFVLPSDRTDGYDLYRQEILNYLNWNKSMLSDEQIKKFQLLWKNRFGKEISREDVFEKGAKLLRLIELIYKPMTETEYKKLQERRKEINN